MLLPAPDRLHDALRLVHAVQPPTPQIRWPLLERRLGTEAWLKHENHTAIGAFKLRGGLTFMDHLRRNRPAVTAVVTATRGNHGQSVALAARRAGLTAVVVVPHGNSAEKNAAMAALGAELVEHGADFQDAAEHARTLCLTRGLFMVPSFHEALVRGVATCGMELLQAAPELHTVYVPIGLGSGICGMIAARAALNHRCRIVGVVSSAAPAYALSFRAGQPVSHPVATRVADGLAVRTPSDEALGLIWRHVDRVVAVGDDAVEEAMRALFTDTHNVAEGAGAAALAAALQEHGRTAGRPVGMVLSGGNVDAAAFAAILAAGGIRESRAARA